MKKAFLVIPIILLSLLCGCSGNSDPADEAKDDVVSYMQKNYQDFSKSTFENETETEDKDNDIYGIDGKMLDKGGWEHSVSAKVQLSPNKSSYIVCELWIDGKEYVSNSPRSAPSSSQDSSGESVSFDFYQQNLRPEPQKAYYQAIIANKGASPIDGAKFKIKCASKDISILVDDPGKIETKDHLEYTWTVNSEINPNESINKNITFQSKNPGNYKINIYPYDLKGNAFYDSEGKQTMYEIDLDLAQQSEAPASSGLPPLQGIIPNSADTSSHN